MASEVGWSLANSLIRRDTSEADDDQQDFAKQETLTSWSILILITLLIVALYTSYVLQTRRIQAVHETVISIFAGMFVGLILRITATDPILNLVSFDYKFFFNALLPPIILASGYELHQGNFFRHIGSILTFAFVGTFISAIVLGLILYVWELLPIESMDLSFVEAISVGATLSATDPVTILAIFNTYKVDPDLYTIIFGESILNDAVAIVLFETAQRYKPKGFNGDDDARRAETDPGSLTLFKLVESFGIFFLVFFGSLLIGLAVGIGTSLLLKFTHVRRYPRIESSITLLIAYASYFFANAVQLSGIVALLFCGICLKHYAYYNMSRRTQLTTKFIFQVLAQLSENFIFIYLGLSLFTESGLEYRPLFIIITVVGICVARFLAVFPLSRAINWVIRYRAKRRGNEPAEEIPFQHQAMLYWAGLRGAVGVALAAGLTGHNGFILRATVLVVVVLTVIIFGGTTARMLEILGIRTGVSDEVDSDDEFDIEVVHNGAYYRGKSSQSFGHNPKSSGNGIPLSANNGDLRSSGHKYSSGNIHGRQGGESLVRKNSLRNVASTDPSAQQQQGLLDPTDNADDEGADLDLPPSARRPGLASIGSRHSDPARSSPAPPPPAASSTGASQSASHQTSGSQSHASAIRSFLTGSAEDPARWFKNFDEEYLKPHLLLDHGEGSGHHQYHQQPRDNGSGNV